MPCTAKDPGAADRRIQDAHTAGSDTPRATATQRGRPDRRPRLRTESETRAASSETSAGPQPDAIPWGIRSQPDRQNEGMPEWGTNHPNQPWFDDLDWFGDPYRLCCTANAWWGELLACYVMGAKGLWNHDELFDYQDRFLVENRLRGIDDWRLSWRPFYLDMWEAYRANY